MMLEPGGCGWGCGGSGGGDVWLDVCACINTFVM